MNQKALQKDEDVVVSQLHPLLWVSTAQHRRKIEMDSVPVSLLNETLERLQKRFLGGSVLRGKADRDKW